MSSPGLVYLNIAHPVMDDSDQSAARTSDPVEHYQVAISQTKPLQHVARPSDKQCDRKRGTLEPQMPVKLAIFDIDDTFVRGDSFKWFCWFAARINRIQLGWLFQLPCAALLFMFGRLDAGLFKLSCLKALLAHRDGVALNTLTADFVERVLLKRVHTVAVDRLRWHQQQNHSVIFLSASPDLYLKELGSRLAVDCLICTKFLSKDGQFTGELFSANCKGVEKRRRLLETYPTAEIAWDHSFGYGNSADDVSFLELVGNAVAVNPDAKLREIATQRNWAIEAWR
jgi:HAD superfamily hydrolase (TIGR01490 family)